MSPPLVARIAHDGKKADMLLLARDFEALLRRCELCATATTGTRLTTEVGLVEERLGTRSLAS